MCGAETESRRERERETDYFLAAVSLFPPSTSWTTLLSSQSCLRNHPSLHRTFFFFLEKKKRKYKKERKVRKEKNEESRSKKKKKSSILNTLFSTIPLSYPIPFSFLVFPSSNPVHHLLLFLVNASGTKKSNPQTNFPTQEHKNLVSAPFSYFIPIVSEFPQQPFPTLRQRRDSRLMCSRSYCRYQSIYSETSDR